MNVSLGTSSGPRLFFLFSLFIALLSSLSAIFSGFFSCWSAVRRAFSTVFSTWFSMFYIQGFLVVLWFFSWFPILCLGWSLPCMGFALFFPLSFCFHIFLLLFPCFLCLFVLLHGFFFSLGVAIFVGFLEGCFLYLSVFFGRFNFLVVRFGFFICSYFLFFPIVLTIVSPFVILGIPYFWVLLSCGSFLCWIYPILLHELGSTFLCTFFPLVSWLLLWLWWCYGGQSRFSPWLWIVLLHPL